MRRGLDEIHLVEAYATRLHLRLGQRPITEAYVDAADALGGVGAYVHDVFLHGSSERDWRVERDVSNAEHYTQAFIDAARRWHQDHLGQD